MLDAMQKEYAMQNEEPILLVPLLKGFLRRTAVDINVRRSTVYRRVAAG